MAEGLGVGDNTRAMVITRGLAEMTRLGVAMGGDERTFAGLTGLGDLMATCLSRLSRNRRVGEELANGHSVEEITAKLGMVAEGVKSAQSVVEIAAQHGVEVPVAEEVAAVVRGETVCLGRLPRPRQDASDLGDPRHRLTREAAPCPVGQDAAGSRGAGQTVASAGGRVGHAGLGGLRLGHGELAVRDECRCCGADAQHHGSDDEGGAQSLGERCRGGEAAGGAEDRGQDGKRPGCRRAHGRRC